MRPIATLVMSIAMAFAAIGLAVAAPGGFIGGDRELASAEIQSASGAVSIANSRAGQAVFSAAAMRPGEGVSGAVTIGNDGDRPGRFAVRPTGLQDVAPNGGKLSERVELVLFDVTNVQNPKTIYAGVPADFDQVDLGVIAPGQERDYLFAATLPDGDDARQPVPGGLAQPRVRVVGGHRRRRSDATPDADADADPDAAGHATPRPRPRRRRPPPRRRPRRRRCRSRSPTRSACPRRRAASRAASSRCA